MTPQHDSFEQEVSRLLDAVPAGPLAISCPDGRTGILMTSEAYETLLANALVYRGPGDGRADDDEGLADILTAQLRTH